MNALLNSDLLNKMISFSTEFTPLKLTRQIIALASIGDPVTS